MHFANKIYHIHHDGDTTVRMVQSQDVTGVQSGLSCNGYVVLTALKVVVMRL